VTEAFDNSGSVQILTRTDKWKSWVCINNRTYASDTGFTWQRSFKICTRCPIGLFCFDKSQWWRLLESWLIFCTATTIVTRFVELCGKQQVRCSDNMQ